MSRKVLNLYALRPLLHLQINANIYVHRFKKVSGPNVFSVQKMKNRSDEDAIDA